MIEFSLVFLLFITMVAGVFEVGRAIWTYNSLMHAAKQGARYAMVHGERNPIGAGDLTVKQYVEKQVVGIAQVTPAVVYEDANKKPGTKVTVSATHTLNFIVAPLLGFGQSVTLQGSSTKTILN